KPVAAIRPLVERNSRRLKLSLDWEFIEAPGVAWRLEQTDRQDSARNSLNGMQLVYQKNGSAEIPG
ncbi:MAG: hypothetical protein ACOYOZ_11375, partial [Pirellula sp.]